MLEKPKDPIDSERRAHRKDVEHTEVPPEFVHLLGQGTIPWDEIASAADKRITKGSRPFAAYTDAVIEIAHRESMKKNQNAALIRLGLEACLTRGRVAEALFLSSESSTVAELSMRAIVLFVLSDAEGLRSALQSIESLVDDKSPLGDRIRLSTARVLLGAAERDMSVVECIMEFDKILEAYPEQVEEPLTETMFTLYVVGSLLREVGQPARATRIADTLDKMARTKGHRMFLALVENLRGNISNSQGDLENAGRHYLKFKEISQKLSFDLGLGMAMNNLGTLKLNSLELEEALQYFEKALQWMDMDAARVVALVNLGQLATILGKYPQAEEYLKQAQRLEDKTHRGTIEVYTWFTILFSKTGRMREAGEFLDKARQIADSSEKPMQKCAYLHSRGVYAAAQHDFDDAVRTFEKMLRLSKENSIFETLVRAELELVDANLQSYRTAENPQKLLDAAYHLDNLIQIAKEQEILPLQAKALLLRSDILSVAGRRQEAEKDLDLVVGIASVIDDIGLETEARDRLDQMKASGVQAPILRQPEIARLLDRLSGFRPVAPLREIPKPGLHAFIVVSRENSLPDYVYYFDSKLELDSSLFSGFLSAITSFTSTLMGDKGMLRSVNHEGFVLMLEHTSHRIVTLIADEETFDLRYRLHELAQRFESDFLELTAGEENVTPKREIADGLVRHMLEETPA